MKTRTSQNGIAGLMSRLILNIKSTALALAALVLAAPPAYGDCFCATQDKNFDKAANWENNVVPSSGANLYFFGNDGTTAVKGKQIYLNYSGLKTYNNWFRIGRCPTEANPLVFDAQANDSGISMNSGSGGGFDIAHYSSDTTDCYVRFKRGLYRTNAAKTGWYIGKDDGSIAGYANFEGTSSSSTVTLDHKGTDGSSGLVKVNRGLLRIGPYATMNSANHIYIGANTSTSVITTNRLEVDRGTLSFTASKHVYVGFNGLAAGSLSELCVKGSGKANIGYSIVLGNKSGGTLTVMDNAQVTVGTKSTGGHVNMCYDKTYNGDPSYLNLDGGTLTTMNVRYGSATAGNAFVTFNGGTLKANQANTTFIENKARLFARVGANGGTIDSAGFAITIPASLASGVSGGTDGGMTFKGGGTVTLSGANTYTGGTTVEIGTTIVVPDTSLGGGLAVSLPATQPAVGTTNILVTTTGEGVFTDSDLPDVTAFPFYRAMLSDDAKSILVVRGAPTITVTGFNLETGEITLDFENMNVTLDLVVAWDTSDHGETLTSWPSGKSVILGTVEAGATTGTFTLPDEVQTVGTYYRLFLGDSATKPYDEEVAWIQPNGVGAYIKTTFTPTQLPTFETKINLTGNAIESGCDYGSVFDAGTAVAGGTWVFCNASGKIGARRYGYAYSSKTYSGDVTLYGIWSVIKSSAPNATFMVNSDVVWADGFNNTMNGSPSVVRFWAGFKGEADSKQFGASAYRFIYSKWWTPGKTTLEADFIPVKKGSEYGLYDKIGKKLYLNAGASGTSFKGGTKTAYGPVTFADGQMGSSDPQRYYGTTVLDEENCSITMDGATATINWALEQPGGESADIVAVFKTGSAAVTNVLATGVGTGSNDVATVENVYATGQITVSIFARSGDNKSVDLSWTFPGTTVASVPSTPVLSVDETLHQIAATGMVSFGVGTTSVRLEYGATTSYGKTIDLTLDEDAWSATIPYDDALWKAGKVYVRVTAANEIAGIFGTSKAQKTATANASFTAANRTVTQTAFDHTTGSATFTFGGGAVSAQDLVVAWGDRDYGENLASWPRANRKVIGSVAADATTGMFTLPPEACVSGTYYRFFLGDEAILAPYDEEFDWIKPYSLGAYIKTAFKPSQNPKAEFKMNMDNKGYAGWGRVFRAAADWPNNLSFAVNTSGQIYNVRIGEITFNAVSKTADHVITLSYQYSGFSSNSIKVDETVPTPTSGVWNNYNQNYNVTPQTTITLWANADGTEAALVKLYYMKWMSNSGTLEADFIPVKKDGEFGLYDKVGKKLYLNSGAEGTSFVGGKRTGYSPVTFATVQTAVTDVRIMGPLEIVERDWERPGEHVTLNWSAPMTNATLWVVYSKAALDNAPDESVALSDWDARVQLPIDNPAVLAADVTGGTFELVNPIPNGYKTMRFVIATSGSTESNLVPLLFSEPYKTMRAGTAIFFR